MTVTRWSDGLNELLFQEESPCTSFFNFKLGAHCGIFFTVLYVSCFSDCTRLSTKAINQPLVSMPHYVTCKFSLRRENRGKNHTVCTRL